MLYQNNPTPEFSIANPLATTINESENIISQLQAFSEELENSIAQERETHSRYRDALETYEMAETEELYDVVIMAQQKEGPLGGIPVSGEGYKIALTHLKNNLRKGMLEHLWKDVDRYRRGYEMAQIELEQAQTKFKGLCKITELKANVLRASTI